MVIKFEIESNIEVLEKKQQSKEVQYALLESYLKLVKSIVDQDFEKINRTCKKGILLAKKIEHYDYAGKFKIEEGISHARVGSFEKALKAFKKALFYFKKSGRIAQQIGTLHNIGLTYVDMDLNKKGCKVLYKTAKMANENLNKIDVKLLIIIYINLAKVNNNIGLSVDALNYFNIALELSIKHKKLYLKGKILFHLADYYTNYNKFSIAKKNLNKAAKILYTFNKDHDNFYVSDLYCTINRKLKNYEASCKEGFKAIFLGEKIQLPYLINKAIANLLKTFTYYFPTEIEFTKIQNNYSISSFLDKAEQIAIEEEDYDFIIDAYELKINFFKRKLNWKKALIYKEKVCANIANKYKEETKIELGKQKVELLIKQKDSELKQQLRLLKKEKAVNLKLQNVNNSINNQNEVLLDKTNKLQEILRELERLAFITSHDLKEPLRNISSFLQILKSKYKDTLDEDGISYINFSLNGAHQIKKLIEGLLFYTQLNNQNYKFKNCDLHKILYTVVDKIKTGNKFKLNIQDKLPIQVVNEKLIHLLFYNLIDNAVKYKSQEELHLKITHTVENETLRISFQDNGNGIEIDNPDLIFDIFKKHHNNKHANTTGLGLTICKKIVKVHNGKIWFESKANVGTTFHVELSKQI